MKTRHVVLLSAILFLGIAATYTVPRVRDLQDVRLTSPAAGNLLIYNGTRWTNGTMSEAAHATNADYASEAGHATNADYATYAGLATNATYATLATNANEAAHATNADLATSATSADTLKSDATVTNLLVLEGGGVLVKLFGNLTDGQYLKLDGTNITSGTPAGSGDMEKAVYDVGDDGVVDTAGGLQDGATVTNLVASTSIATPTATVNDLTVTNDASIGGDLAVTGTISVDEIDTDVLVITNSLTVDAMYVNTLSVTNNASFSNAYAGGVIGTNTVEAGSLTVNTNASIKGAAYAGSVVGTNSGTFGTLLSVTNAAITWGVEAVTQSGGTNYTLPFAGTASYPNTYLAYTMTGNLCFEFTTNRAAGRGRTVILYGNGKNGRLDFNADNHLIGTLANGIVVTNTFVLSFWTGGTDETNVFVSGQYAE